MPSMISTILSAAAHNCLPQLRSLGRSSGGCDVSEAQYISQDSSYHRAQPEVCELREDGWSSSACSRRQSLRAFSPVSSTSLDSNGIGWMYAHQGITLLDTAAAEAQVPRPRNQAFSRKSYIHGLTYLIQALPSDLSNAETICIEDALHYGLQRPSQHDASPSRTHPHAPSFLHRLLASIIVQFFLLVQFLLPCLRYLLQAAYRFERAHHISEKMLMIGVKTGERFGRLWWDITQGLLKLPDDKLAVMLMSVLLWWVQGISGGIQEGIGEGMSIIGASGEGREGLELRS